MSATEKRKLASLLDRNTVAEGWVYMIGMQALVRLPLQQSARELLTSTTGFSPRTQSKKYAREEFIVHESASRP